MAKKKDSEKQNAAENSNKNGEEPNYEDPDGYVDDVSDDELLPDVLARKPKETDGFESVIIVDGIPEVGTDRLEKLKGVIEKIFSKFGTIVSDYYPKNDQGVTKGYVFIEYNNAQSARDAVAQLNNYKLDKKHTFLVNLFTDYEKFTAIPDQWEPPTPAPFPERPNLQEYLLEPDAYDQYLIFDSEWHVQIWQNSSPHPTLLEDRERWTESFVRWSPLGTYLATCHKPGVALWGGPNFTKVMRFVQSNVQVIDFSPCEQYLITLSPHDSPEQKKLIIFDIRTGMEKRSFVIDGAPTWPIFRWSKDDKYFARISPNLLSVYETPSFGLLDKKSIPVNGIRDFMWSPSDNVLAYWVAEDKDVPAKVVLLEIPSRQEIRANNLFNVADCKIHWQKNGDYLCVKVDRYAKLKKGEGEVKYSGMHYNFEIFHMREKNIPVDIIEIKEPIQAFAWEPIGSKFAIVQGEQNNTKVAFYDIKSAQKLSLMKLLEKKVCSHLFWSPAGQYIVLAECRGEGGALEFIDTNDFSTMASGEHYKATQVEWDPTGRYVVSAVSAWSQKMDTGFWVWSFQGKVLRRNNLNTFCEFKWRPRPPTLLSEKQLKDIKKNLKKYTVQFEQKDRIRLTKASKDVVEKRQKLWRDFQEYREKRIEEWKQQKDTRLQLRHNIDTDNVNNDSHNHEEEIVEFIVKEEITVID